MSPAILAWFFPGAAWFHHELIPSKGPPLGSLDPRTIMAIWQLGNCPFYNKFWVPIQTYA